MLPIGSNPRVSFAGYNGKLRGADEEVQAGELLRVKGLKYLARGPR